MSIMNVLEDVRIEKKIKNKYPGIRSSFIRAYRELIDKDFFGTAGTDLNDLNFIDRINLYTKGGATQGIKFTPYEQTLLHMIEGTETYDDVMRVARLVSQYMKEQAEEHKKNHPEEFEEDEDGDYGGIDTDGYDDSDEFDEEEENRQDGNSGEEYPNAKQDDEQDSEFDSGNQAGGTEVSEHESLETKSYTDEAFRKNEKKLYATDGTTHYYGNIPNIKLEDAIVSHKALWKRYRESADNPYAYKNGLDTEKFMKLRNDSKKVVGYLAKEFELRKNADQLKRASIAKTGDLNMSKIYAYQLTDDIFKKMTIVPGAKSHGLVMFLDWSGSMSGHMENTMKQLINLVMFVRR
jgi:cobalamin biosynthesis protein CobT